MATSSSTRRQDRPLNSLVGIGVCIGNPVCEEISGGLFAKTRIKTRGDKGEKCYFDICGWGDVAQSINALCRRGNVVAFEATLSNVKGEGLSVEITFVAKRIEIIRVPAIRDDDDVDRQIKVLDMLNPEEILDTDMNLEEMKVKYGKSE